MPAALVQLIAKFALSARCQGYTLSAAAGGDGGGAAAQGRGEGKSAEKPARALPQRKSRAHHVACTR